MSNGIIVYVSIHFKYFQYLYLTCPPFYDFHKFNIFNGLNNKGNLCNKIAPTQKITSG